MTNQMFLLPRFKQKMRTLEPDNVCQKEWRLENFTKLLVVLIPQFPMSKKSYCAVDDKEGTCKAFLLLPFVIF